jgi:hypothetical protein
MSAGVSSKVNGFFGRWDALLTAGRRDARFGLTRAVEDMGAVCVAGHNWQVGLFCPYSEMKKPGRSGQGWMEITARYG